MRGVSGRAWAWGVMTVLLVLTGCKTEPTPAEPQPTCGGGGTEGLCGGTDCAAECPAGYACTGDNTCTGGARQGLVLDMKSFEVEGRLLIAGAPIADTTCTSSPGTTYSVPSFLELTEVSRGSRIRVLIDCAPERGWTFRGQVPPGAYRVDLRPAGNSSLERLPFRLEEYFSVQADRREVVFDLDTSVVTLAGRVTHNGQPLFTTAGGGWGLRFTEVRTGATFELSVSADGGFQGRGTRGLYRVEWRSQYDTALPQGFSSKPISELRIDGSTESLVLNVATVPVAGHITRDGQPLLDTTCSNGNPSVVRFIDPTTRGAWDLPIRCTEEEGWSFSGNMYPGNYQVAVVPRGYNGHFPWASLPQGVAVALPSLELRQAERALMLDVKTHEVSGSLVRGGAALPEGLCDLSQPFDPSSEFNSTYVTFLHLTTKVVTRARIECSSATGWTFQGRLLPGRYAVTLRTRSLGSNDGAYPLMDGGSFSAPFTVEVTDEVRGLVLDVTSHDIAGRIQTTRTCPFDQNPKLTLLDPVTRVAWYPSITCTEADGWTFSGNVYPGTYTATLSLCNRFFEQSCTSTPLQPSVVIEGPRADLELKEEVQPVWPEVSGTLTRNGQQLGPVSLECGRHVSTPAGEQHEYPYVVLIDEQGGSTYRLRLRCGDPTTGAEAWTFSGRAPPGRYRVEVQLETPTSSLLERVPGPTYVFNWRLQLP